MLLEGADGIHKLTYDLSSSDRTCIESNGPQTAGQRPWEGAATMALVKLLDYRVPLVH